MTKKKIDSFFEHDEILDTKKIIYSKKPTKKTMIYQT